MWLSSEHRALWVPPFPSMDLTREHWMYRHYWPQWYQKMLQRRLRWKLYGAHSFVAGLHHPGAGRRGRMKGTSMDETQEVMRRMPFEVAELLSTVAPARRMTVSLQVMVGPGWDARCGRQCVAILCPTVLLSDLPLACKRRKRKRRMKSAIAPLAER
jgi:hypothetical protein